MIYIDPPYNTGKEFIYPDKVYLDRAYHIQNMEQHGDIKTPYQYVEYESDGEHKTAYALDSDDRVKFFCKLPRWFKIPTPVGDYNPDWAIVLEDDKKVYLIRETKSTHDSDKRRRDENLKIRCGEAHFRLLDNVDYRVATSVAEVLEH
jgi:type III restriction enzyme